MNIPIESTSAFALFEQDKSWEGLTTEQKLAIFNAGLVSRISAGTVLFGEQENGSGGWILLEGKIRLQKVNISGKTSVIALLQPVNIFNLAAVMDGGKNTVTAICVGDCLVWNIPGIRLLEWVEKVPRLGVNLLRILAEHNRRMLLRVEELVTHSVLERTAKLILELSYNNEKRINRHEYPNLILAAQVGTVPEAFCRALNKLIAAGLIHASRGEIQIVKPDELRLLADRNIEI